MKKSLLAIFAAFSTVLLAGCGVNVIDYNDKLVELGKACYTAEEVIDTELNLENYEGAQTALTAALNLCAANAETVKNMEGYKDDTDLRDAFAAVLDSEVVYLEKYGELIAYYTLSDEEWTDEVEAAADALFEEVSALYDLTIDASDNLQIVQEAFATRHGYELEA